MKKSKKLARKTKVISIFVAALLIVGTLITILPGSRNWLKADAAVSNYNPNEAAAYAIRYWQNYNSDYPDFNSVGGDCANFVSQCLVAGGLPTTSTWGKYTSAWKLAPLLKDYLISIGGTLIENPTASQISVGDVLVCNYKYCDSKSAYDYGHIYICVKVENGVPWVCSHNSDRYYSTYSMGYSKFAVIKMGGASTSLTAPVVTTSNKYYAENAQVTVNWNAVSGATDYWFVIWRDGQQIFSQSVGNTTSYTFNTTKGDYGIYVIAGNGSTNAQSECCQFYVGKLDTPVVTTSNKYYAENAQVTINWDSCEGATGYWVHIWRDGENIVNQSVNTATSYSLSTTNGFYEVCVEAFSEAGGWQTVSSDVYTFYSGYLEKPIVTTESKYYVENSQVTINWNACEGATKYHINIWKNPDQRIVNEDVTGTSYTFTGTEGYYGVFVDSINDIGGYQVASGEKYNFNIVKLETPVVTTESKYYKENEEVTINWNVCEGVTKYHISIWKNPDQLITSEDLDVSVTSYKFNATSGKYGVYIDAINDIGGYQYIKSEKCNFYITKLSLNNSSESLKPGASVEITPTVDGLDPDDSVTWKSSNTKIATVSSSGQVKAVGLGRATITATAGKASATCTVDVVPDISLTTLGASIRISDPYGIRYGIQLKKDSAYKSTDIVEYGTLIIASGTLGNNELTIDTKSVRRIPAEVIYQEDSSQLTYTGVLINIPTSFFGTNVKGRGYLIYRDVEGVERVMYSAVAEKNFYGVAQSAYDSYSKITNPTAEQTAVIKKLKEILANR